MIYEDPTAGSHPPERSESMVEEEVQGERRGGELTLMRKGSVSFLTARWF